MPVFLVQRWHGPIRSVRLDEVPARRLLLVDGSEDQLQMLTFALEVSDGQDAHRELEDVQFHDAGARVTEGTGGGRIHRQRGHFGDRVPAGRTDS